MLSPIATFKAVYIGSRSILCGPVRPNLMPFDNEPFSGFEDMVGVNGPPPSESVRDRLVMAVCDGVLCGQRRGGLRLGGSKLSSAYAPVTWAVAPRASYSCAEKYWDEV